MGLRDKLAELKRITGADKDPFDPARWNVHADFWWFSKWQDFQMHKDRGDVLEGEFWMLNGRLFTRNYWPEGIPAPPKPFGWDEWHAANRVSLTPFDEIRNRIKASLEQYQRQQSAPEAVDKPAVIEPAPESKPQRLPDPPLPRGYGPVSKLPGNQRDEQAEVDAINFLLELGGRAD